MPQRVDDEFPETVHITYEAYDTSPEPDEDNMAIPLRSLQQSVDITGENWIENSFKRSEFPETFHTLQVSWSSSEQNSIKRRLGLDPPVQHTASPLTSLRGTQRKAALCSQR